MLSRRSSALAGLAALVSLAAGACEDCEQPAACPCRQPIEVTVVNVVDGDTVDIEPPVPLPDGSEEARIRLLCLSTPDPGDCYSSEATAALRRMVGGQTVRLTFGEECRGKWDRLLANIWLEDTLINAEMARGGYGGLYDEYAEAPCCEELEEAMEEAAAEGAGGWMACSGEPFAF